MESQHDGMPILALIENVLLLETLESESPHMYWNVILKHVFGKNLSIYFTFSISETGQKK